MQALGTWRCEDRYLLHKVHYFTLDLLISRHELQNIQLIPIE